MIDKQLIDNAVNEAMMKVIYNSSPTMIHEDDYEPQACSLCNKEMSSIHDTHNAFPLAKLQSAKEAHQQKKNYRCCSDCNEKVMKARFDMLNSKLEDAKVLRGGEVIEHYQNTPRDSIMSMFETPQAQKRFKELGQNFYKTQLGKIIRKRRKKYV